jgi:hypothetical protein
MKELMIFLGFGMIALLSIHINMHKKEKKHAIESLILVADLPKETKVPTPFLGKKVD